MRAYFFAAAALAACASLTGCHPFGKRHAAPGAPGCDTCGPVQARPHGGLFGGKLFHKNSDMCDVCAAGGPTGPYAGGDMVDAHGGEIAGGVNGPAAGTYGPYGMRGGHHVQHPIGGPSPGPGPSPVYGGPAGPGPYGPAFHGTPGFPHDHYRREYIGPQGPSTPQVAYPYYTVRGPRDFLQNNPPSIGR